MNNLLKQGYTVVDEETLYVVQTEGQSYYKIGHTNRPSQRLSALQVGCPFPLKFAMIKLMPKNQAAKLERRLHLVFSQYRTGGEWFMIPPRIWGHARRRIEEIADEASKRVSDQIKFFSPPRVFEKSVL